MNCYRCGSKLGSGRTCLRCGADVSVYRRIVHISNNYYNAGLEKARLRDLSGAVESLGKSLQFDKKNIDARNLLGLVYFEMGEVVEALSQWVISKNYQPTDNLADEYLNELEKDRNQLESMNQAIKKFNQALYNAKHDGVDLAIIQLRRVIRQHPHMIKAYQLLALIYINDGDYSHASRLLRRALKIDQGNTLCLKYSRQIRGKMNRNRSDRTKEREENTVREAAVQDSDPDEEPPEPDVIVPTYRERSGGLRTVLAVLAGVVIAACMYQFVIARTITRNNNLEDNQTISAYITKLSDKELEIEALNTQVADLETEREALTETLDTYTDSSEGVLAQYDALLDVVQMVMENDSDQKEVAASFSKIDSGLIDSDAFSSVYGTMEEYVTVDILGDLFDQGMEKYNTSYYKDAIAAFEECLDLDPDYDPAIYYLGLSYEKRKDSEKALEYYQQIVEEYPESEYYEDANKKVEQSQTE